ncbi:MAG: 6-phosphogluconolactonase [Rudaea sp.]
MSRLELVQHEFDDSETLARTFARETADALREAIAARGHALIALSGGNTPRRFLERLGEQQLDWARTTITLADERWVPPDNARSNEHLLRETLLRGNAGAAHFVSLHVDTPTPEQGLAVVAERIANLVMPFDVVVLGMGDDGHCASLFPDGDNLQAALNPLGELRVMPMRAPDAPEPRITLTLAALIRTRRMYLQIEGETKGRLFARIRDGDPAFSDAPVRSVLEHSHVVPIVLHCR